MSKHVDVLTFGGVSIDIVVSVDELPGWDQKTMARLEGLMSGSPAGNYACAASRLGLTAMVMSEVGDDAYGEQLIRDFEVFGVDTSQIIVREGMNSNFTISIVDPTGEKAIIIVPEMPGVMEESVAAFESISAALLFGMPSNLSQYTQLSDVARRHGTKVMIDVEPNVGLRPDNLEVYLPYADIASFNAFGFASATGKEPSVEAARELLKYGPQYVVVTRGANGAIAVSADESVNRPGQIVPVVDTTGAGDTFNAAFSYGIIRGMSLDETVRFAIAASALSVRAMGPRGDLPTEQDVREFLSCVDT